ncbi:uncharacterized protein LOC123015449 [Tribolium madens]|uniref:uncharacterized protein LOC123015449 n=1 Tax=Tribolium madens TaxID=41895 RepID=UPI001CF733D5|nr:uncharacterized protein LOC123015449 [Tribolium madens]
MKYFPAVFVLIVSVRSAPSKEKTSLPQTVYDQKQTGDYNIQLHLKDFQVIALLGDEAFGDYDYNYDYSDFTIKPPTNITLKPPPLPENATTAKPQKPEISSSSSEKPNEKPSESSTAKSEPEKNSTDSIPVNTSSPDKIKVQIINESNPIVPIDDMGTGTAPTLGEVLHYRKCASGYARDKRGRCRRVRKPGNRHQLDLGRLATNLAARFRAASEEDSVSHSREA